MSEIKYEATTLQQQRDKDDARTAVMAWLSVVAACTCLMAIGSNDVNISKLGCVGLGASLATFFNRINKTSR